MRSVIDDNPSPDTKDEQQLRAKPSPSVPYEEISALRFRRVLEQPVRDNPEDALDAILRLANSTEFQDARRALYTAEALAAAGQLPPEEFGRNIDVAVSHYNQVVAAYGGATGRRVVHHVVPFLAGELPLTHIPGAGAAGSWLAQGVLARLLPLPPPPQPAAEEGAAIAMAQAAMSAVCARSSPSESRG